MNYRFGPTRDQLDFFASNEWLFIAKQTIAGIVIRFLIHAIRYVIDNQINRMIKYAMLQSFVLIQAIVSLLIQTYN